MATRDPRIDAYIAKQRDFARPILVHLREVVHAACPEVEETLKWSSPHFGKAAAQFAAFSASHRREYVEWMAQAKRTETKAKRVAQAVGWIAEEKGRNWKYGRAG